MKWLKRKLTRWLGIDLLKYGQGLNLSEIQRLKTLYTGLVSIGVDVHFKEPHMILVYSKINGGQLHHIEADFKDLRELQHFVCGLKEKYAVREATYDTPFGADFLKEHRDRRPVRYI